VVPVEGVVTVQLPPVLTPRDSYVTAIVAPLAKVAKVVPGLDSVTWMASLN
jgi:hypothetical protein